MAYEFVSRKRAEDFFSDKVFDMVEMDDKTAVVTSNNHPLCIGFIMPDGSYCHLIDENPVIKAYQWIVDKKIQALPRFQETAEQVA